MREKPAPQQTQNKIIIGFLFSIFIVGISSGFAQSLGDVAREERERREEVSRRRRVYTNEDLARTRVAVRESREEATPADSSAAVADQKPAEQNSSLPLTIIWPNDVPLGDVARFYRKQKELESVQEMEFAIQEPPILDLDFLLPTPLASPLPDFSTNFSNEFLPPPSVREPAWNQSVEPANAEPEGTVRVERGDTLWKIAARHLGDGKAWPKLAEANPELKDPNRIHAGRVLRLPGTGISPMTGASSSERIIRVQAGDSLWKLAAAQMGNGDAWSCLAAANPQIENVNRIYPGQLLLIPANCFTGA
jgi:LysM repeat protein